MAVPNVIANTVVALEWSAHPLALSITVMEKPLIAVKSVNCTSSIFVAPTDLVTRARLNSLVHVPSLYMADCITSPRLSSGSLRIHSGTTA
ncbi:MAG: hypothetical protein ACE5R6_10475 [Candidatus Heimdallarchaeota archaeon]